VHVIYCHWNFIYAFTSKAPTQAEIRLKLTNSESRKGLELGTIGWLSSGMDIELAQ
jgi:hypothetical protein